MNWKWKKWNTTPPPKSEKINYTPKRKNVVKWHKNALKHFYFIFISFFRLIHFFLFFEKKMKCVSHFIFIHFISFFHFIWFFWFLVIFKLYFIFFQISFYFIFLYESCFISFFCTRGGRPAGAGPQAAPRTPPPVYPETYARFDLR